MTLKVLTIGGDGIGPEVLDASLQMLVVAADSIKLRNVCVKKGAASNRTVKLVTTAFSRDWINSCPS
jgi:isocitrate/isopropylmalate dehydrogenase